MSILDQALQQALADHGVLQRQAGEFDLLRMAGHVQMVEDPVVKQAVILEFKRTQGMGDTFQRIGQAVGEVVHGIDRPGIAGAMVLLAADAVQHRIAHVDVIGIHADARAQYVRSLGELAGPHAGEQVQVLLDAAVAVRAVGARFGQRAPGLPDGLAVLAVDIGVPVTDQVDRVAVQLVEIVRGMAQVAPFIAQPTHVFFNRVGVFGLFLFGVGVVEAQVAVAAEGFRHVEVQADGLGVADMQVSVRFGGEPGHNSRTFAGAQVFFDDPPDEVGFRRRFRLGH